MLRGKPGTDISTLVANGSLDAFLPYNMRFSDEAVANPDKEQEAVEYIKDNLRARNYLSYETDLALRQLELTIQQLDSELSDQDLTELEQYIEGTTSEQTPATNEAQVTEEAGTAEERNNEAAQEPAQGEAQGDSGKPAVDSGNGREGGTAETAEAGSVTEATADTIEQADASAKLSILKDAASRASKWLKQTVTRKANAKNQSLLTAIPDLFSTLVSDGNLDRVVEFVPDGLQDSDNETLGKVQALYQEVAPKIEARIRPAHSSKREISALDDLYVTKNGKADLDENVKIALALAGLAYMRDSMDAGPYNDKEAINKMLGQPKEARLPKQAMEVLGKGYSRYSMVANSIGENAVKLLGIKPQKDAPENYLANIQTALGVQSALCLARVVA